MADWKVVAAQIKAFEGRREVVKAIRKTIREPVPLIRRDIKARALSSLPRSGGLAAWVAASKVSASIKIKSRTVGLLLKGGRNSSGGRSDINAIDRGRVRAPSWGRKGSGDWHNQTVSDGFFSLPASYRGPEVERVTTIAVDRAFDTIRRG